MLSFSALDFANSGFASHSAIISTKPNRRAASTCAGPMKPVPMMPALMVFMRGVWLSDVRDLRPALRLLGIHHRLQHRHALCAVHEIRVNVSVPRDGVDEIGDR